MTERDRANFIVDKCEQIVKALLPALKAEAVVSHDFLYFYHVADQGLCTREYTDIVEFNLAFAKSGVGDILVDSDGKIYEPSADWRRRDHGPTRFVSRETAKAPDRDLTDDLRNAIQEAGLEDFLRNDDGIFGPVERLCDGYVASRQQNLNDQREIGQLQLTIAELRGRV